jgi:hypothetical protein
MWPPAVGDLRNGGEEEEQKLTWPPCLLREFDSEFTLYRYRAYDASLRIKLAERQMSRLTFQIAEW